MSTTLEARSSTRTALQLSFRDAAGDDLLSFSIGRLSITNFDPGHLPGNLKCRPCERPTQHLLRFMEACEQDPMFVGKDKRKARKIRGVHSGYLTGRIRTPLGDPYSQTPAGHQHSDCGGDDRLERIEQGNPEKQSLAGENNLRGGCGNDDIDARA